MNSFFGMLILSSPLLISCNNNGNESISDSPNSDYDYNKVTPASAELLDQIANRYTISVTTDKPLLVNVEAKFVLQEPWIQLNPSGSNLPKPYGWATFVDTLVVKDSIGVMLPLKKADRGRWDIDSDYRGRIIADYTVNFDFATKPWPAGNEASAFYEKNSLYSVTKPFFMYSGNLSVTEITFDLPETWEAGTTWFRHPDKSHTFIAEDTDHLMWNCLIIGEQKMSMYKDGDYTFVLALMGEVAEKDELIFPAMKQIQSRINTWFPSPNINFLQVLFFNDSEDGEAFSRSSAISTGMVPDEENIFMWGNTIAHEMLHLWHAMPRSFSLSGNSFGTSQWTSEGFTEYLANLAMVREGLITEDQYIKMLEKHIGAYLYYMSAPAFESSLLEAGNRKSFNRHAVYSGGYTVAFALDIIIRENTRNEQSFDDFIRQFYDEFAGKRYSYEDIVRIASKVAEEDLSSFFEDYVKGTKQIPVRDYLKKAGFRAGLEEYAGFVYLWENDEATATERELFQKLITGN